MAMKKPSSVGALERAAAAPRGTDPVIHDLDVSDAHEREQHKPARVKDVRISLNVPPDLYRDFLRWLDRQAEARDVPKIDVQKGLRGLIRGVIGSPEATVAVGHGINNEIRGVK